MVDGGFYIVLLSNASARICPQSTSSNFTAQLVRSLELSSWWEVGLVKIHYQYSWNSISKDTMSVIALQGKTWQYTLWKGYYPSPSMSTECMNHLNPHNKASSIDPSAVSLVHDPIIRKIKLKVDVKPYTFSTTWDLVHVLRDSLIVAAKKFPFVADITGELNSVCLYMDLVEHQLVGDFVVLCSSQWK